MSNVKPMPCHRCGATKNVILHKYRGHYCTKCVTKEGEIISKVG